MPIFMNFSFGDGGEVDNFEIDSFSFGVVNASRLGGATGGGGGTGKVAFHEITVTKHTDAVASPRLLVACDEGNLLPAVQLIFVKAKSQTPYLTYNLKQVLVSSIQWSSGGDRPTESISLA